MNCYICGFQFPDRGELIHVKSPTLHRGAIHLRLLDNSFCTHYGAPYRPELYPLLHMSTTAKIRAILLFADLTKQINILIRQPKEFQRIFL